MKLVNTAPAPAPVVQIEANRSRSFVLQQALYDVICQSRFDDMTLAETVSTLEFLKWDIINRVNS